MKKIAVIFAAALAWLSATAGKPTVAVNQFDYGSAVGQNLAVAARSKVMEGITATGRVNLTETSNDASLGAEYVIDGHLISVNTSYKTTDGKTNYTAKATYSLKVTNSDGEVITSQTFEASSPTFLSSYSTQDDAITAAIGYIDNQMKDFVDDTFKIPGTILEIAEAKKNEAKKVYISVGSDDGVRKGLKFDVTTEKTIANRTINKKIGELKVEAVEAGDVSLAKVTKNGVEIMEAINSGETVKILSKKDGGLF